MNQNKNAFHWYNTQTGEICINLIDVFHSIVADIKGIIHGRFKLGLYSFHWKYSKKGY